MGVAAAATSGRRRNPQARVHALGRVDMSACDGYPWLGIATSVPIAPLGADVQPRTPDRTPRRARTHTRVTSSAAHIPAAAVPAVSGTW